mmetsp:Transcript_1566/g.2385  ORF Transcript_1566/g.2385 Transcript_1566/m.2385 type:complete len:196 (-) Transcript_1566:2037-2624(-)
MSSEGDQLGSSKQISTFLVNAKRSKNSHSNGPKKRPSFKTDQFIARLVNTSLVVLLGFTISCKALQPKNDPVQSVPSTTSSPTKVLRAVGCKAAENCLQTRHVPNRTWKVVDSVNCLQTRHVPNRTWKVVDSVLEEWGQGASIENNASLVTSLFFCGKELLSRTVSERIIRLPVPILITLPPKATISKSDMGSYL